MNRAIFPNVRRNFLLNFAGSGNDYGNSNVGYVALPGEHLLFQD